MMLLLLLKIIFILFAMVVGLLLITFILPWNFIAHEINTEKYFKGQFNIWGGVIRLRFAYPFDRGWQSFLVHKMGNRLRRFDQINDSTGRGQSGDSHYLSIRIWRTGNRLPGSVWRQVWKSLKFETCRGSITIGFTNPAYTGMVFGGLNGIIISQGWQEIYAVPDFVGHQSHFKGKISVKFYPVRIIFLAVKHGFKSLKLFRSEK